MQTQPFRNIDFIFSWTQSADGESNKILSDKKKTVTARMFDTYVVRNHYVANPVNTKLIRLKEISKNRKLRNTT